MSETRFEIRPPRLLTLRTILALSVYGLLVSAPVIIAMLVVSVSHLSAWTFVLPVIALLIATFWLPLGFGNPLVVRLVRGINPPESSGRERFVVQLTLTPRLRTGWRASFEDADDFGWLEIGESGIRYYGDSVSADIPWSNLGAPQLRTSGWRALFAYGPRILLDARGLGDFTKLEFAERSSWAVPGSRRNARAIYSALVRGAGRDRTPPRQPA